MFLWGSERQSDTHHFRSAGGSFYGLPIHRTMELGEADDTLKVTWFAPDAGRVVVEIDAEPRRMENRGEGPYESINEPQSKEVGSVFD